MSECTACPTGTDECAHREEAWVRRQGHQVIVNWSANHPTPRRSWAFDFPNEQEAHGCFTGFETALRTGKDTIRVLS